MAGTRLLADGAARLVRTMLYIVLTLVVLPPTSALACTCPFESAAASFASADVVFDGTAVAMATLPPTAGDSRPSLVVWTFAVESVSKGSVASRAEVVTALSEASCGVRIQTGSQYEVFAVRLDGNLVTGLCTGTHELKYSPVLLRGLWYRATQSGWAIALAFLPGGIPLIAAVLAAAKRRRRH